MGRIVRPARPARAWAAFGAALVALLWLSVAGAAAEDAPVATITLRPDAVVHGPRITLGAVAEVESDDPELLAALTALDLGRAPLPNQTVYLNEPRLRTALRRARLPERDIAIGGWDGNVAIVSAPRKQEAAPAAAAPAPRAPAPERLAESRVVEPVEVRRGQRVGLVVRYGPVEIVTMARLEESARVGDVVRVRREGSDHDVWGLLVSPDRVEVDLAPMTGGEEQ